MPDYNDDYFSGAIRRWHEISYNDFSSFLLENIPPSIESALDLGCGDGFYGKLLKERASRLVGCDGSVTASNAPLIREYYDRFLLVDIEKASPEDFREKFDLIFSTEVIEHLSDYKKLIRLAYLLLNRNGTLIITTTTYYLYIFYYLVYSDSFKLSALFEFVAGLVDEAAASDFIRRMWMLTGGHHHGFIRSRLLHSIRLEGFLINAVRYANVQPTFPTDGLDTKKMNKATKFLLKGFGRATNSFCRKRGMYGPNILISAKKQQP